MKPGHWLALGSAIAGCAAALGIYLTFKGSSHTDPALKAGTPRPQPASAAKRQFTVSSAARPQAAGLAGTSAAKTPQEPGTAAAGFRIHGKPPKDRITDEHAWFANAERVAREANHELENLRETLELSPYQQQRIFDIMARNSPAWMPGMLTGGSYGVGLVGDEPQPTSNPSGQTRLEPATGDVSNAAEAAPAVSDELLAVLDYDQQQALMEEELDRRAWWEEILPQLLPPDFPVAVGADLPAASLPGNGETKAYEGPTGLLEE